MREDRILIVTLSVIVLAILCGALALAIADPVGAQTPEPPPTEPTPIYAPTRQVVPTYVPTATPHPGEPGTVTGKFLFDGQPPPVGQFQVALCVAHYEYALPQCELTIPGSPMTQYFEDGSFRFDDVPAGVYGIIWYHPYASILVHYSNGQRAVIEVDGDVKVPALEYSQAWCEAVAGLPYACKNNLYLPIVIKGR